MYTPWIAYVRSYVIHVNIDSWEVYRVTNVYACHINLSCRRCIVLADYAGKEKINSLIPNES